MASIELSSENFDEIIGGNDIVVVDFWATWCGPCQGFGPVFEAISEKYDDIVFAKVNTEEQQELAGQFQVRSIPTLTLFREQIIVFSQAGALPGSALEQVIGKVKALDMDEVRRQAAEQAADQKPRQTNPSGATVVSRHHVTALGKDYGHCLRAVPCDETPQWR